MAETNASERNLVSSDFIQKVHDRTALVGIIGLGYVGLPLAYTFVQKGFKVLGFDLDQNKIDAIAAGKSYMKHFSDEKVASIAKSGNMEATKDMDRLGEPDALLICVPTPLSEYREPDLSYVVKTTEEIAKRLRPGQLVVLESTTYPGTSDEVMKPILEEGSGLSAVDDFGIAYSPEREDPGNPNFDTGSIPKVVGAESKDAQAMALALYSAAVNQVVPVSNARTAEAVKLTENIFRLVNIGLVNELKTIFTGMDIDVWEVIDAAKTKPFGYMPFYPGPGLGGHCIPIDPFYLTWKARADGNPTRFIELAGEINSSMPKKIVSAVAETLNDKLQRAISGSHILVLGVAYKKNIDDMRESPSMELIELLQDRGANVTFHDPYVSEIPHLHEHPKLAGMKSTDLDKAFLGTVDLVLIATDHDNVDYGMIQDNVPAIVDTRNAMARLGENVRDTVVKA